MDDKTNIYRTSLTPRILQLLNSPIPGGARDITAFELARVCQNDRIALPQREEAARTLYSHMAQPPNADSEYPLRLILEKVYRLYRQEYTPRLREPDTYPQSSRANIQTEVTGGGLPDIAGLSNKDVALKYLAAGFAVIPICWVDAMGHCLTPRANHGLNCELPGKKPLISWKEFEKNLPRKRDIEHWWSEHPDANIAIITGTVSHLVVLDFDQWELFDQNPHKNEWLDVTPVIRTGRGVHVYLRSNEMVRGRHLNKIDLKGEGGYVIAPPSLHKSGVTYTRIDEAFDSILSVTSVDAYIRAALGPAPYQKADAGDSQEQEQKKEGRQRTMAQQSMDEHYHLRAIFQHRKAAAGIDRQLSPYSEEEVGGQLPIMLHDPSWETPRDILADCLRFVEGMSSAWRRLTDCGKLMDLMCHSHGKQGQTRASCRLPFHTACPTDTTKKIANAEVPDAEHYYQAKFISEAEGDAQEVVEEAQKIIEEASSTATATGAITSDSFMETVGRREKAEIAALRARMELKKRGQIIQERKSAATPALPTRTEVEDLEAARQALLNVRYRLFWLSSDFELRGLTAEDMMGEIQNEVAAWQHSVKELGQRAGYKHRIIYRANAFYFRRWDRQEGVVQVSAFWKIAFLELVPEDTQEAIDFLCKKMNAHIYGQRSTQSGETLKQQMIEDSMYDLVGMEEPDEMLFAAYWYATKGTHRFQGMGAMYAILNSVHSDKVFGCPLCGGRLYPVPAREEDETRQKEPVTVTQGGSLSPPDPVFRLF